MVDDDVTIPVETRVIPRTLLGLGLGLATDAMLPSRDVIHVLGKGGQGISKMPQ